MLILNAYVFWNYTIGCSSIRNPNQAHTKGLPSPWHDRIVYNPSARPSTTHKEVLAKVTIAEKLRLNY